MCQMCDKLRAMGKKLTPEEAARIEEKERRMEEIAKTIFDDVAQFVVSMRDKYGDGTFPPLVQAMARMIGNIIGQIDEDEVREGAVSILFEHLNGGFNEVLPKEKQTAFSITTTVVDVDATEKLLEELKRRAEAAKDMQVKPPILH